VKRFNENKRKGLVDEKDKIGGDIGIHGVPFISTEFGTPINDTLPHADYMIDKKVNWTLGCISLKTEDIKELYKYVPVGTEIEIVN
jgi:lipoprotein-anchoring transpeptidase ErfK/SrfK